MHGPPDITTLYRPTGEAELRLVIASGFSAWPERLSEQPIFHPVTNEDYAVQIASDWNATPRDIGFVMSFDVETTHLSRFDQKVVGDSRTHVEYWIPAEDLDEFNHHIVGRIRVIRAFPGSPPREIDVAAALVALSPDR
jgi:hypothetical protein